VLELRQQAVQQHLQQQQRRLAELLVQPVLVLVLV
jgi:hypothetical protein